MNTEQKIVYLAKLKKEAKELDTLIKDTQAELLTEGVACDTVTEYGKLCFQTRENYETVDKMGLVRHIGQKAYNANSTISKSGVEKAIGELGFQEALDKGFMRIKGVSEFFVLRK